MINDAGARRNAADQGQIGLLGCVAHERLAQADAISDENANSSTPLVARSRRCTGNTCIPIWSRTRIMATSRSPTHPDEPPGPRVCPPRPARRHEREWTANLTRATAYYQSRSAARWRRDDRLARRVGAMRNSARRFGYRARPHCAPIPATPPPGRCLGPPPGSVASRPAWPDHPFIWASLHDRPSTMSLIASHSRCR